MEEFRISAQEHIIDDVIEHLENGCFGRGIAMCYDYTREKEAITFKLKAGAKVKASDLFWFGYFTKN